MKLMPNGTVAKYCAAKVLPDQKYDTPWFSSMVPLLTASKPSNAGSNSPAANTWILMRPLDSLSTRSANAAALPGPT